MNSEPVAELVLEQMAVGDASSLRVHWLTDGYPPVGTKLYTHPVKEQGNPVAWRSQDPDGYWSIYQAPVEGAEPLYTGFKELTDEGIEKNTDYWADKANWIKKNEPVAWMNKIATSWVTTTPDEFKDEWIPLYTHPVKEQLSNGHLSDCAIHNEPASRNKPCDCGFEPKFNLSDLKHEDSCRYFDDGSFCTCGAEDSALVEWYRHKEVTHPVKEEAEQQSYQEQDGCPTELAVLQRFWRKAQEK